MFPPFEKVGSGGIWILLGYLTRAHGISGALSYRLLHPESDCLREGLEISLSSSLKKGEQCGFKIRQILSGHRLLLEGITDRTAAEKLTKTEIWVKRSDLRELPPDEVYLADLIGFEAVNPAGDRLGQVTGFSDNRAQILVEIEGMLVPFVKPILLQIDDENKKIILDVPQVFDS